MEQAKTCEEYVLGKMIKQEEEIGFLNAEIKRLSDIIKNYENPKEEDDKPSVNESIVSTYPGNYYTVCESYYIKYNKILRQNEKDPEWLRLALEDDERLSEFMNFKCTLYYADERVGEIKKKRYDLIVKDSKEDQYVIDLNSPLPEMLQIDSISVFLSKEMAMEFLVKDVRDKIKAYFNNNLDKDFEEASE